MYVIAEGKKCAQKQLTYLIRTHVIPMILCAVRTFTIHFVQVWKLPYKTPSPKMAVRRSFFEVLSCNVHRMGIGSKITIMSMIRSAEAMAVYICCALVTMFGAQGIAVWEISKHGQRDTWKEETDTDHICITTCTRCSYVPLPGHGQPPYVKKTHWENSHSRLSLVDRTGMHQPRTFLSSRQLRSP